MTAQAPSWWGATGIRSTKGHLVRGDVGSRHQALCGKRPNQVTGWISPPSLGANCRRCVRLARMEG